MAVNDSINMEYRFYLQTGKSNSSPKSLAQQANEKAMAFYGTRTFSVDVDVFGSPENYTVECRARARIEV